MDRKLKEALKQNFTPPPPQDKDNFISTINYPKASFTQLLLSQIGFIRKRVWIGFILLLISAFVVINCIQLPADMISMLSAMLPIFSLLAITEVYKSLSYNMAEMELTCKYNLLKITLIRLSVLGLVGFVILLIYVLLANSSDYGAFRNLIYLSVPYLASINFSLAVISKFKSKDISYICGAVSFGVSAFIIILNSSYKFIYSTKYIFGWLFLFTLLFIILAINLVKFKTAQEELQWNLL